MPKPHVNTKYHDTVNATAPGGANQLASLLGLGAGRPWMKKAACAPYILEGSDFWLPQEGEAYADARQRIDHGREVCEFCPVRAECLGMGLEPAQLADAEPPWDGEEHVVYGSLTLSERRAVASGVNVSISQETPVEDLARVQLALAQLKLSRNVGKAKARLVHEHLVSHGIVIPWGRLRAALAADVKQRYNDKLAEARAATAARKAKESAKQEEAEAEEEAA